VGRKWGEEMKSSGDAHRPFIISSTKRKGRKEKREKRRSKVEVGNDLAVPGSRSGYRQGGGKRPVSSSRKYPSRGKKKKEGEGGTGDGASVYFPTAGF